MLNLMLGLAYLYYPEEELLRVPTGDAAVAKPPES